MTPTQRTAALRLISAFDDESISRINDLVVLNDAIELLRELAQEPQAEPVRECADNDSPWLVCKTCAAVGRCAKQDEPVAWCSLTPSGKIAYFDGKPMVMPGPVGNEVHRTPLYAHPQQRKPLTDEQIDAAHKTEKLAVIALMHNDVSVENFTRALRLLARLVERAHGIKEAP